jgi:hypothetical protein
MSTSVVHVTYRAGHTGFRVWLLGVRAHHGAAGAIAAVAGVVCHQPVLVLGGLAAMCHDHHDWKEWFSPDA